MLKINNYFIKGLAYRYKALQCTLKSNSIAKTIHWLTLSANWLEKAGSRIEVGKTNIVLIRFYLERGDTLKAKTIMSKTTDMLIANEFNLIPDDLRSLIERERNDNTILPQIMGMTEYMTDSVSDDQFFQHLIACANRLTGAERGALLVVDDNKSSMEFHLRASKNITADQMLDRMFQPSMQMIHETIRMGEHRRYAVNTSVVGGNVTKGIIRSSICVPLVIENSAIGALYHDNRLLSNVFKDSDVKLLNYFAALAAVDLERKKNRRVADQLLSSGKNNAYNPSRMEDRLAHVKGMVGKSRAFTNLLKQIERVIDSDLTVLITGETGVGKSLVASVIHRLSSRSKGPLITVQCSALAEGLITSELFGHEKGSFTGAVSRQIGRFELADGGTLFMDEVGDLSLEIQSRLLRVLQNKEFERVGGGEAVLCSDFRLIAATNKVLEREIQAKRFRKDLYYRINVLPLQIPPLRHRKEDIPLLVDYIIGKLGLKPCHGKPQPIISQDKIKALMQYNWPGNIRELENVIQRSLIADKGDNLSLSPLTNLSSNSTGIEDFTTLEENERRHICFAMEKTRGKIQGPGGAAELLQINHSTLTSKIKKLGIRREHFLFHQP